MARKVIPSSKRALQKRRDEELRAFIFENLASTEGGGGVGYAKALIENMDVVYAWIKGVKKPRVVVDNTK